MDCFDALPVGCYVEKFLVVHGGIGEETELSKINSLNRFTEPPKEGVLNDLLWADPIDENANKKDTDIDNDKPLDIEEFGFNDTRGCS